MNKGLIGILAVFGLGLIFVSQAFYIVDQREQAIVLQLGQPVGDESDTSTYIKGPGLHFKIPVVQEVRYFDRRVLSIDPAPDQVVISNQASQTGDQSEDELAAIAQDVSGEPIIVDAFARYKIVDPLQFLKTLGTISIANNRLGDTLTEAARSVLGSTTLETLLSERREGVMAAIQRRVNDSIQKNEWGIEIVDVRIVRADLTSDLLTSTVRRMISELKERATETRAKGEELALKIRSEAEKERTVILANSQRDSQIIRGEGDEEAIRLYADAFNKDKEFYSFIRSLEAYDNTLASPETKLILSPDSEFFKHFSNVR